MEKHKIISNDPAEDIAPISPYGAVEYSVDPKTLASLVKQTEAITVITSAKDVTKIMPYIAALRENRLTISGERKTLKEGVLQHGRLVDSEAKVLIDIIHPEELRLQGIRKLFEDSKAIQKQRLIEAERARADAHITRMQEIADTPGNLIKRHASIQEMAEAVEELTAIELNTFEEFAEQARGTIDTALAVVGMALNLAQKAEKQREIDQQFEADRKLLQDKADAIEAARLANERETARLKQEEIDQADKIKAAKKKVAQAKADKKAQADRDKERADRIELMRPDSEKLVKFVDKLRALKVPDLASKGSIVMEIEKDIEKVAERIIEVANKMIS